MSVDVGRRMFMRVAATGCDGATRLTLQRRLSRGVLLHVLAVRRPTMRHTSRFTASLSLRSRLG